MQHFCQLEQSLPQQQRKVTKDSLVFPTDNVHTITSATTPVSSKPVSASNPPSSSSFGGLKAGFFNSKPPTTTKKHDPASSTVEPVIEVVKPKQTKEDALRIDEVQEAMKSKLSLLEKQGTNH